MIFNILRNYWVISDLYSQGILLVFGNVKPVEVVIFGESSLLGPNKIQSSEYSCTNSNAFQTTMWYSNLGKFGANTENHLENGCFSLVVK